ncbi:hypothetical protein [Streptacidiphilus sp. PAMC 29251]
MNDKAAAKGILVTTAWYGKSSLDFAQRTGRMQTHRRTRPQSPPPRTPRHRRPQSASPNSPAAGTPKTSSNTDRNPTGRQRSDQDRKGTATANSPEPEPGTPPSHIRPARRKPLPARTPVR